MARIAIEMPRLGYDMEVGVVSGQLKGVGNSIAGGIIIAEIGDRQGDCRDGSATASGTLAEIVHGAGDEVAVGEPIAGGSRTVRSSHVTRGRPPVGRGGGGDVTLEGKVAIVTGAGQGNGRAIALRLARDGAAVLVNDLNPDSADAVAAEIAGSGRARGGGGDVSAEETWATDRRDRRQRLRKRGCARQQRRAHPSDAAGPGDGRRLGPGHRGQRPERPVRHPGGGCRDGVRELHRQHVLDRRSRSADTLAAVRGQQGGRHQPDDQRRSRACATRIRVNAVCPGVIDTALNWGLDEVLGQQAQGLPPGEFLRRRVETVPLGRIGTPDDVAGVVAFLAGPDASYVTGQSLNVDGGLVSRLMRERDGSEAEPAPERWSPARHRPSSCAARACSTPRPGGSCPRRSHGPVAAWSRATWCGLGGGAPDPIDIPDDALIVPGLVDLHTHVFAGVGDGVDADAFCLDRGSTTVADGGSAGAATIGAFARVAAGYRTRVLAWLNLSSIGLVDTRVGELVAGPYLDVPGAVGAARLTPRPRHRVQGSAVDVRGRGRRRTRAGRAARSREATGLPVMVHIGDTDEPLSPDRASDSGRATWSPMRSPGRKHGILRGPVGSRDHGGAGTRRRLRCRPGQQPPVVPVLEAAAEAGFLPDTLSTDANVRTSGIAGFGQVTLGTYLLSVGVAAGRGHRADDRAAGGRHRPGRATATAEAGLPTQAT